MIITGATYLKNRFILIFLEFNSLLQKKGRLAALNREWFSATVIKTEDIRLNLDPEYATK